MSRLPNLFAAILLAGSLASGAAGAQASGAAGAQEAATQDAAAANPAKGDAEKGHVLSITCMGCHAIASYRNAYPSYRVPMLGGQHEEYLFIALQGYKTGTRPHKTMHAQASTLADQDLRNIAAFFASEGGPKAGPVVETPGKQKAATCAACHGEAGISPTPNWPVLAGQWKDYLVHALHEYKSGVRKDPVMGSMAMPLSDQDILDVADYFSRQSGLFTIKYEK